MPKMFCATLCDAWGSDTSVGLRRRKVSDAILALCGAQAMVASCRNDEWVLNTFDSALVTGILNADPDLDNRSLGKMIRKFGTVSACQAFSGMQANVVALRRANVVALRARANVVALRHSVPGAAWEEKGMRQRMWEQLHWGVCVAAAWGVLYGNEILTRNAAQRGSQDNKELWVQLTNKLSLLKTDMGRSLCNMFGTMGAKKMLQKIMPGALPMEGEVHSHTAHCVCWMRSLISEGSLVVVAHE